MRLMIWKQNEGPTDGEFKQGDIFMAKPNTWNPGSEETIKWLVVEMPNYGGDWAELTASDYTVGSTPDQNVMLHIRKYYLDLSKLNTGEVAKWLDPTTNSPIIANRFTLEDILRR